MVVMLIGLGVVSESLWSRTRGLEREVAMLQRDRASTPAGVAEAAGPEVAGAEVTSADLEAFKTCVNTYMRTIGVWSANVGSKYEYNFCK